MHVVARLSDYLLTQLRAALGHEHTLVAVSNWGELSGAFHERVVDVAVLEPTPLNPDELAPLLGLLARHPAVPVIVYTSVSPAAMRVTVELARRGVHHVVFRGIDDAPGRFRALMMGLAGAGWRSSLWPWVEERVTHTPEPLVRAVRELFRVPHEFADVSDLTKASGLTRRTVERWLSRVGITSPKLLVMSARVERGHYLMRSSSAGVATVAERLGYSSARLFSRQVALATGWSPSVLRSKVSRDDLLLRLTAALDSGGGNSGNSGNNGPHGGRGGGPPDRLHRCTPACYNFTSDVSNSSSRPAEPGGLRGASRACAGARGSPRRWLTGRRAPATPPAR